MKKKHFKALLLDLDGTTILNQIDGKPSQKVKDALNKARRKIHVGVTTSRPYFRMKYLIPELNLSGPSIIHGGAQIMNASTKEVYKEYKIHKEQIQQIYKLALEMNIPLWVDEKNAT